MPAPAGLDYEACATAITNALTVNPSIPDSVKTGMLAAWKTILDEMFTHILANLKVTVTIPHIPSVNFTPTLVATVTTDMGTYPVDITSNTIAEVTVPDPTVTLL